MVDCKATSKSLQAAIRQGSSSEKKRKESRTKCTSVTFVCMNWWVSVWKKYLIFLDTEIFYSMLSMYPSYYNSVIMVVGT